MTSTQTATTGASLPPTMSLSAELATTKTAPSASPVAPVTTANAPSTAATTWTVAGLFAKSRGINWLLLASVVARVPEVRGGVEVRVAQVGLRGQGVLEGVRGELNNWGRFVIQSRKIVSKVLSVLINREQPPPNVTQTGLFLRGVFAHLVGIQTTVLLDIIVHMFRVRHLIFAGKCANQIKIAPAIVARLRWIL